MQARETAMLILQRGNEAGRRWPLERGAITIGRDAGCDIVLPDRQVSRRHAQIQWTEDGYVVEDLGSKNGTHINGRELNGPQILRDGDEIQIALSFKLAFVDAGETAPLTFGLTASRTGVDLDKETRQVWVNGMELDPPLSVAQYRLLELLLDAEGSVVAREMVVRTVWPEAIEEGVSEQAIDALVRRLRERLAEHEPNHHFIITVRGHGFRFHDVE